MIIILFSYLHNTLYTIFHDTAMHIYIWRRPAYKTLYRKVLYSRWDNYCWIAESGSDLGTDLRRRAQIYYLQILRALFSRPVHKGT